MFVLVGVILAFVVRRMLAEFLRSVLVAESIYYLEVVEAARYVIRSPDDAAAQDRFSLAIGKKVSDTSIQTAAALRAEVVRVLFSRS